VPPLALPPELGATAGLSVALYTLLDLSCCTLLDIISVDLPEGVVAELVVVSDLLPPVKPEGAVALFPPVNPEVAAAAGAADLFPPKKLEVLGVLVDLDPLEKLLELLLLPPEKPPLLPPLASTKLAPAISKLITIANHRDFLNMLNSFHFCCLIN
jgi:hypothetical protein